MKTEYSFMFHDKRFLFVNGDTFEAYKLCPTLITVFDTVRIIRHSNIEK